jgi:hypothetical protein
MPANSGSEGATAPHRLLLRFIGKEDACSGATAGRDRQCALGGSFIALFAAKPALIPQSRERASRLRREALLADGPKSLNFYERWILPPLLDWTMQQRNLKSADAEWLLPCAAARSQSASVQG